MDTSIPAGTRIVGIHEDTGQTRVLYLSNGAEIDIVGERSGLFSLVLKSFILLCHFHYVIPFSHLLLTNEFSNCNNDS